MLLGGVRWGAHSSVGIGGDFGRLCSAFDYNYSIWYFFVVATLLTAPVFAGFLYDATGTYTSR
jgi:hypothetical protein